MPIFIKEKYENVFKIGKFRLGNSDILDLEKLRRDYNEKMEEIIEDAYETIRVSHEDIFSNWKSRLLDTINDNIVSYNPSLTKLNKIIQEEEKKIRDLESKQRRLKQHDRSIKQMMAWKEV